MNHPRPIDNLNQLTEVIVHATGGRLTSPMYAQDTILEAIGNAQQALYGEGFMDGHRDGLNEASDIGLRCLHVQTIIAELTIDAAMQSDQERLMTRATIIGMEHALRIIRGEVPVQGAISEGAA